MPSASTLMAKLVPSKPTQDTFALLYTCKNQHHLQIEMDICWVFPGECASPWKHSLSQVEAWASHT